MTRRKPLTDDDPRHGTPAGFAAHYRGGTKACRPCLDAHNKRQEGSDRREYNRRWRQKRREQRQAERAAAKALTDDEVLRGGRWSTGSLVRTWIPDSQQTNDRSAA